MPNSRSAKKRQRQGDRRREANRANRSTLRNAVKRVRAAESAAEAETAFKAAERLLDRAARKGLTHRNTAARAKQRLRKAIAAKT